MIATMWTIRLQLSVESQGLAMPKENRADKRKSRPGLVDPYALYQNLRTPICKPLHLLYLNELLRKFGGIENSSYICGKITYYERGYSC